MKKIILKILLSGLLLIGTTGCNKENEENDKIFNNINVSEKLDTIINNGPKTSSIPFDYIKASQDIYVSF